ncbi:MULTISPECIES: ribokinase [unclassified Ruegeria]|uniref:ribokinase n=1 Tax=unclassified Ruegeria TaxID=2625375 RepID=UPI00148980FF|nr:MULTISPECIES: ribokinase [unclassified Ruegeria]NOD48590.1 ribokinase [Ruegeria sp. HKCCD5849]NOD52108.1 ribokinase [Ruegeria sp. HKCCD5851]NOD66766.1 ribokinase [Ruegeria sp. HKCCD7303]NOE33752.1 ribokinase [Ruegeria sp. HKCCD7318]
MTIWNLGSINADMVYDLPHLPAPGETLAALGLDRFLGGKGANMSVAAARAGSRVSHIGAVGQDGRWAKDRLTEYGVDTRFISEVDLPTGHAIIAVDAEGENLIILYPGANHALEVSDLGQALSSANTGDLLILQNETNAQVEAAQLGHRLGLTVCYAAAPFQAEAVKAVLPYLDFLILNEVEAEQLRQETGLSAADLPVRHVIVTLGSKGARYLQQGSEPVEFAAHKVQAVDTTGAGDTFTGYVLAGMDRGMPMEQAILQANRAAALMVTRHGTADVIPDLKEVRDASFD